MSAEYVVTCDALQLERGERFVILPASLVSVERGDLCLFNLEGYEIVGRWYPATDGLPWIQLSNIRVELGPSLNWRIVGRVIPVDAARVCLN